MTEQEQLEYVVKVVDEATTNINKITNEMEGLKGKMSSTNTASAASSLSVTKLAGAFGLATSAIQIAQAAIQKVNQEFQESITAVNKYTSAMIGLSSVASAFGESQDKARKSAMDLSKDGLMSVTDAAAGLKNLLGTGFNMQESINLMKTFKDAAAFNRQGTLEFGEAIVGATQGIKNQNSIMVDNVGITKNLSLILEEAGYSMQDLSRVGSDAAIRQALYNGLLREGSVFAGDAGRAAETLAGSQSTLNTAMTNLHVSIGQMLAPALTLFNMNMTDAANTASGTLQPVMTKITQWFVIATETVTQAALAIKNAFITIAKAAIDVANGLSAMNRLDFNAVKSNFSKVVDDVKQGLEAGKKDWDKVAGNTQKVLDKLAKDGVKGFSDVTRDAMANASSAVDKNGEKIAKKLEAIAKKMEDINRSIAKQTEDFNRSVARSTDDFSRQMTDIVQKHKQAAQDLKDQLKDLSEAFDESTKDRADSHNDKVDKIKEKYADETQTLKDNLKRRLTDTKGSDQQLIKFFEAQIKEKEEKRDKEISDEDADFKKQQDKAQSEYEKQRSALQTKLDAEMEIQKKHADEFAKFKDAVVEDDITRAENAFSREMEQMKYQHDQRMIELKRELEEAQAMKDEILGKSTKSNLTYKASGATTNYKAPAPTKSSAPAAKSKQPSYLAGGATINITNNVNSNVDMNAAMSKIGWYLS